MYLYVHVILSALNASISGHVNFLRLSGMAMCILTFRYTEYNNVKIIPAKMAYLIAPTPTDMISIIYYVYLTKPFLGLDMYDSILRFIN